MYIIPSYDECLDIVSRTGNFIFYKTDHKVNGYDISIFNYRLAQFSDFNNNPGTLEMRGLTFVFNSDGTLFKRFILMDKFWNLNQNEDSMYNVVKDLKIDNVCNKEDGSIISFLYLPDGSVVARSKASFTSDQAVCAQNIYENDDRIKLFVNDCLSKDLCPMFEYVGPNNRVVLKYKESDLILIRVRNNENGSYISLGDIDTMGIKTPDVFKFSLNDLINLKESLENIEGWVIQFENGKMLKIKTAWYLTLHNLFTDQLNRENHLVEMILNETIDDAMAQLGDDSDKREAINYISNLISHEMTHISNILDEMVLGYNGDRKDFVTKNIKSEYFSPSMSLIDGVDKLEIIKGLILKKTKKLELAREWVSQMISKHGVVR